MDFSLITAGIPKDGKTLEKVEHRGIHQVITGGEPVSEKFRKIVFEFEEVMKQNFELKPIDEFPLRHFFAENVYVREITMPAGTLITGRVHKKETIFIISQGDISILGPEGVKRVQAPYTGIGTPGSKRLLYAHKNTIWSTIHHYNKEIDIELVEKEFVCDTEGEYKEYLGVLEVEK